MEPYFLILLFSLLFLATFVRIYRIDRIFGFYYLFLYIYTIFAQVGYAYYPELSRLLMAYYGPELFYDYFTFIALSFAAFWFMVELFRRRINRIESFPVLYEPSHPRIHLFYLLTGFVFLIMFAYFTTNYEQIDYVSMAEGEHFVFNFGFKNLTIINVILYCLLRIRKSLNPLLNHRIVFSMLLIGSALSLAIAVKAGNRTDLLAIALGITVVELGLTTRGDRIKVSLRLILFVAIMGTFLFSIETLRTRHNPLPDKLLVERLLFNDYYPPSHILLTAMNYNMVDPVNVLQSNVYNALIKMNYPYLQTEVANKINPGSSSRSTGYAFYIFSEGFMAFGKLGFIYNGIVVFLGLAIWRYLSSSNDWRFNLFMEAIIATQLVNMARSQSSYFIKDIYMIFIPAIFLLFLATGMKPRIIRLLRQHKFVAKGNK